MKTYDIVIIGGGPAGLSCAFYLATRGYKPTVFEKNERPGGMLVYGIPWIWSSYISGRTDRTGICWTFYHTGY